ncbi:hypothetical protein Leryth_022218 [Lithospermum erythrorhizon]|nr:hypothetical protein Leryth_022218 [Lithospermum erythrorhizon]
MRNETRVHLSNYFYFYADVKGSNFIGKYLTFNNSAGPEGGQAVALKVSANYSSFYKCNINGYQDTLLVDKGYQFFRECTIFGTVDFIFGSAPVVFQNCDIKVHRAGGVLTAQSKGNATIGKSGMSFHNCYIKTAQDFNSNTSSSSTFLGRPWVDHATVVFMESFLDDIINPLGWDTMGIGVLPGDSIFYGEYMNFGPGSGMEKRVAWAKPGKLNGTQAEDFSVRNLIDGNYWLPYTEIPYKLDLIHKKSD